ncbi:MAG: F0F1 ATP synthase subunit epsilon [Candidatus Omnitrophota bacterium]
MAVPFHLSIAVPGKIVFDQDVVSLVVPAQLGYLGVLAHHAPIIARLKPGIITLRTGENAPSTFELKTNGFLEFSENKATLILDSVELPS